MSGPRIVITGLGAVTPLGLTVDEMWSGLSAGACGIDRITAFDPVGFTCRIAGEAPPFDVRKHVPKSHRKATKLMSRDIELSVLAAAEALRNSGIVTKGIHPDGINVDPARMAVNLGAGLISCDLVELAPAVAASVENGTFDLRKWGTEGLQRVTPLWLLKYLPNMLACHIGIIHDIRGPSNTITCAETASHLAIAEATHTIARGSSDIAVAGGAEAKVNHIVMIRQCLTGRAASAGNDEPKAACRPFDADATGSVFGEAAGIIVMENLDHAVARGANALAEIAGIGSSNSIATPYEHMEPEGTGLRIAMEKALADAEIQPADIDLVIPHGTAIPRDDLAEAKALADLLGPAAETTPVWPTKSMLSNTGAAAGGVDIVAAVCAMQQNTIPAARNCNRPAAASLAIPLEPIQKELRHVLCCSYTYGGQTAAVVLKKFAD